MAGARASRWGHWEDHVHAANEQVCLIVQVESRLGLTNLDAIAATPGVDAVFMGPADLSASLGHVGQPSHPEVVEVIDEAIARIRKLGKAPGVIATSQDLAMHYLAAGAVFVAVGIDAQILMRGTRDLAALFKQQAPPTASTGAY
jgi:4-hydroxy-2-oxoheptanedioate aldolase